MAAAGATVASADVDALPDSPASARVAPASTERGASSAFVALQGPLGAGHRPATRDQLATTTRVQLATTTRLRLASTARIRLAAAARLWLVPATVLEPACIGASAHPTTRLRHAAATVLEPAYLAAAAPYPTTRLRFAPGDAASSASILGLALAHGATAVRPGSAAYVRASF